MTNSKVLLPFAALLFTVVAPGFAFADVSTSRYTMTVIADGAYGNEVVDGEYETAIRKLTRSGKRIEANFEAQTNLCVAFTKTGSLDKARAACDAAVDAAEAALRERSGNGFTSRFEVIAREKELAIALSNRGVLRAALNEEALALDDLNRAAALKVSLSAPEINLARLAR